MKNLITAFFMAWGNFLSLPCPARLWQDDLRYRMLAMLPAVGLVAGLLELGLAALITWLRVPFAVGALLLLFLLHYVSGFMHLDGFMDVSDAVLSRRDLETRQRILKDSRVGAFAVIAVIFLLLAGYAALFTVTAATFTISGYLPLVVIPIVSRAVSGACVLGFKPLATSQYAAGSEAAHGKEYLVLAGQTILYLVLAAVAAFYWDGFGLGGVLATLGPALATGVAAILACLYGRKQLAGMNGDIAGFAICWGELAGLLYMALIW